MVYVWITLSEVGFEKREKQCCSVEQKQCEVQPEMDIMCDFIEFKLINCLYEVGERKSDHENIQCDVGNCIRLIQPTPKKGGQYTETSEY